MEYDPTKLVSIIIPSFNSESTISRAIESIVNQSYSNLEIIIVDDSSKDSTLSILKNYKDKDKRIRVISSSTNYGPFVCKNYGLKIANGDFFTFHDSDDYCAKDYVLNSYLNLVNTKSKVSYVGSQTTFDEETIKHGWTGLSYVEHSPHSSFFSREVFETIGYFDCVRFGADAELRERFVTYYGKENVSTNNDIVTYFYVKRLGSLTCNDITGYVDGKSKVRDDYQAAYSEFHKRIKLEQAEVYMDFPLNARKFDVPDLCKVKDAVDLTSFKEI